MSCRPCAVRFWEWRTRFFVSLDFCLLFVSVTKFHGYATIAVSQCRVLLHADWFIPFFRVNKLRVLGDDEDERPIPAEGAFASFPGQRKYLSMTEEPTETTEDYQDADLEGSADAANAWMDRLKRSHGAMDKVPGLAGYSISSSSGDQSMLSDGTPQDTFSRFEI
jgi:hypothetical protein